VKESVVTDAFPHDVPDFAGDATDPAARVLYRRAGGAAAAHPNQDIRQFHEALDGYAPTPLISLRRLAASWHVANVDVKLEADRFGLPSFKVMGASWAAVEALRPVLPPWWTPERGLTALAGTLPERTLVTATDGNHGRALARVARLLGLRARIYVPTTLDAARVAAIAAEGARIVQVDGGYDQAVAASGRDAARRPDDVLVSDTSWPGYEAVPAAVIAGYSTILAETSEQLANAGRPDPDLVIVPVGVGALAAAVIGHFAGRHPRTRVAGVEPTRAACVTASLAAGRRLSIPGPHDSTMAGLNCGTPSFVAWPALCGGIDAMVVLDDGHAHQGVRQLAEFGPHVGECSGAVVAAADHLLTGPAATAHRAHLRLDGTANVLLLATEGVTGPSHHPTLAGHTSHSRAGRRHAQ
jgi:diaminopropionate ammonia-lyase